MSEIVVSRAGLEDMPLLTDLMGEHARFGREINPLVDEV